MKSQIQDKESKEKLLLILSDLHLGAGEYVQGRANNLESFYYDQQLVELFNYYSSSKFENNTIELIINGDFLDFLAVPFVNYFDDEYWSQVACVEKLKIILNAHSSVFKALDKFLKNQNTSFVYILGNHDAEMIFDECKRIFVSFISEDNNIKNKIKFMVDEDYSPLEGIIIKHGHDYENPHSYSIKENLIGPFDGQKYFIPPWGSYYVTRVVNKYKVERRFIDAVRPVKKFLLQGILFDTLFTIRFLLANIYFFFRIVFLDYFKIYGVYSWKSLLTALIEELELFKDPEGLTKEFFDNNPKINTLIVGHTHNPSIKKYPDGNTFINTGTWTQMYYLDFERNNVGHMLTYALIFSNQKEKSNLYYWKGVNNGPYSRFYAF